MRRNVEYKSKKKMVTTGSDGFNRQLRVPSEIYQLQSFWGDGLARQPSRYWLKGFTPFERGTTK